jgi:hypothetical protein
MDVHFLGGDGCRCGSMPKRVQPGALCSSMSSS